jgi:hypothetical protein
VGKVTAKAYLALLLVQVLGEGVYVAFGKVSLVNPGFIPVEAYVVPFSVYRLLPEFLIDPWLAERCTND